MDILSLKICLKVRRNNELATSQQVNSQYTRSASSFLSASYIPLPTSLIHPKMNVFEQNKDFYNSPFRLSPDQLQDPVKVLRDFFIDFHLYESRALLADWLQAALTTPNSQFAEAAERNAIALFAEKLEELLEAVSIIIQPAKK